MEIVKFQVASGLFGYFLLVFFATHRTIGSRDSDGEIVLVWSSQSPAKRTPLCVFFAACSVTSVCFKIILGEYTELSRSLFFLSLLQFVILFPMMPFLNSRMYKSIDAIAWNGTTFPLAALSSAWIDYHVASGDMASFVLMCIFVVGTGVWIVAVFVINFVAVILHVRKKPVTADPWDKFDCFQCCINMKE